MLLISRHLNVMPGRKFRLWRAQSSAHSQGPSCMGLSTYALIKLPPSPRIWLQAAFPVPTAFGVRFPTRVLSCPAIISHHLSSFLSQQCGCLSHPPLMTPTVFRPQWYLDFLDSSLRGVGMCLLQASPLTGMGTWWTKLGGCLDGGLGPHWEKPNDKEEEPGSLRTVTLPWKPRLTMFTGEGKKLLSYWSNCYFRCSVIES